MTKNKCFIIYSDQLIEQCNRLPAVIGRASMVYNLISSYKLFEHFNIVKPSLATINELKEFHSELYLNHLKTLENIDTEYCVTSQDEEYGLGYDCTPVSQMFELVSTIAGGSITAAKCLVLGIADVVINWCGGWHHASRDGAEGFCYVNDVVLAIEHLRHKFPRVLYIDLDVHHGNGVQDAYNLSNSVMTLSFHKYEPGFYPGTGSLDDIGNFNGKGYSCNVPLHEGYTDTTLEYIFERVFALAYSKFNPDVLVVQCGADALAHDPNGAANLTIKGYSNCVKLILNKQKPTLLLGGGGYNHTNTARLWTYLTAQIAAVELDNDIPEHSNWPSYGPDFTLQIEPSYIKDKNSEDYLESCICKIKDNLENILVNKQCIKALNGNGRNRSTVHDKTRKTYQHNPAVSENTTSSVYDFIE